MIKQLEFFTLCTNINDIIYEYDDLYDYALGSTPWFTYHFNNRDCMWFSIETNDVIINDIKQPFTIECSLNGNTYKIEYTNHNNNTIKTIETDQYTKVIQYINTVLKSFA